MDFPVLHDWSLAPAEAIALQRQLAQCVLLQDTSPRPIKTIAGVDVSCRLHGRRFHAAVVLLGFPGMQLLETVTASLDIDFPYVPGLLSFRELPVILQAAEKLQRSPDLLLVDGQGLAHPRRFGLACHLGLWLDLPTIGCGKSRLYGEHDEVGDEKGAQTPLRDKDGEEIGSLLRTRNKVKPLYISPGHRVSLASATELALACCTRYRLPEPIRAAHAACNRQRLLDEDSA
ncbi:Endonuclease V [Malonomonas rubra DSM 5091]|uniref:Endonuclease V n=1 Tax=Malonomonas rubra DSM 5091 TaxID=1122189 RepID=A0A1M6FIX8_MALRU|nr:deoxyribonuclease V [Malonomonas rubra]SHI97671.1 Endonuclease V [Malonomonas rubra DSM 5091]